MGTYIRRAPGVAIIVREPDIIQFGVDATRAGLIRVDDAPGIAGVLRRAAPATTRDGLAQDFIDAGIPAPAAASLVQELVGYGLWQEFSVPGTVIVWGRSPLAASLADALRGDGFRVRTPGPLVARLRDAASAAPAAPAGAAGGDDPYDLLDLDTRDYLEAQAADVPIVLVDVLDQAHALAVALAQEKRTWLPVTGLDTRVLVGPLRRAGRGPCPLCLNLHRAELDPFWPHAMAELVGRWPEPDPLVAAAAAARVIPALRSLTGVTALPGATPLRWVPGELHEVDPFGTTQVRYLDPHPHCPACFAAAGSPGDEAFVRQINAPYATPKRPKTSTATAAE